MQAALLEDHRGRARRRFYQLVMVICFCRDSWKELEWTSGGMWKYVNVRRLFIMIEQSIDRGTQWAVFEPNTEPTWIAAPTTSAV